MPQHQVNSNGGAVAALSALDGNSETILQRFRRKLHEITERHADFFGRNIPAFERGWEITLSLQRPG